MLSKTVMTFKVLGKINGGMTSMNKKLIKIVIIALIFFGIWAVAAESNLNTFTLRADRVLTDYIGGNATADKVNITGLVIQTGQVLGYYNESATDTLLDAKADLIHNHALGVSNVSGLQGILDNKADASDLTVHTSNTSNPHSVTRGQIGAAASSHNHSGSDITSPVAEADNGVPTGGIIMWAGTISSIPSGWQLCDGTGGTPDLRDKFVKGVPNSGTDPGATGGSVSKTTSSVGTVGNADGCCTGPFAGAHDHTISDIRPPYYELAYICKT